MRLIGLLIVLLVIGWLVARQMHEPGTSADTPLPTQPSGVPDVPTHADQVPQFKKQMNDFVDKQNAEQKKRLQKIPQ